MTRHTSYDPRVTGTDEEKARAQAFARTWPGMASFAIDGDKECRQCEHWQYRGYDGQRNLKQAPCAKFKILSSGSPGPKFPGDAKSCKYFQAGIDHPYHSGMEGDYRQVHGPDHLWRETRRAYRAANSGKVEAPQEGSNADNTPGIEQT